MSITHGDKESDLQQLKRKATPHVVTYIVLLLAY